ncbi:TPA: glutamyl-tRNA amidotransferase [Candidatus Wolfebacteria bacterium]|nr:glutamyl-tRNA amidotransferase [Candidatus Wolfebacteria bacterium]
MIKEQLMEKIKESMKAGTSERTNILRLAMNAINNRQVENRGKGIEGELSDEDVIDVLMKEVKRRNESATVYAEAGRQELADVELAEIVIFKEFLPEEISTEELDAIVTAAIEKTEAKEIKDMGKVMAEINPQIKGRADSKAVSDMIKSKMGLR